MRLVEQVREHLKATAPPGIRYEIREAVPVMQPPSGRLYRAVAWVECAWTDSLPSVPFWDVTSGTRVWERGEMPKRAPRQSFKSQGKDAVRQGGR